VQGLRFRVGAKIHFDARHEAEGSGFRVTAVRSTG
jgi:hypothetical protein